MSDLRTGYFDATEAEQQARRRNAHERRKAEAREAGQREREERQRQERQAREAAEAELPAAEEQYHDARHEETQAWDALVAAFHEHPLAAAYLDYDAARQARQRAEQHRASVQARARGGNTPTSNAGGAEPLTALLDKLVELAKRDPNRRADERPTRDQRNRDARDQHQ